MKIRKLDKLLEQCLQEVESELSINNLQTLCEKALDEKNLYDAGSYIIEELLEEFSPKEYLNNYKLEEIINCLLTEYGFHLYNTGDEIAGVINVKNRPKINNQEVLEYLQNNSSLLQNTIQNFIVTLRKKFKNFIVYGKSGGYWGFNNLIDSIQVTPEGKQQLINNLMTKINLDFDNSELDLIDYIREVAFNYQTELYECLLEDQNYLCISDSFLKDLQELNSLIEAEENQMNTQQYWKLNNHDNDYR